MPKSNFSLELDNQEEEKGVMFQLEDDLCEINDDSPRRQVIIMTTPKSESEDDFVETAPYDIQVSDT